MLIGTILTVSSSHITKEDDEKLWGSHYGVTAAPLSASYEGGHLLYAESIEELGETLEGMEKEGYSEAFIELYKYAVQDLGVSMLRIDRDGDEISHLNVFDW